MNGWLVQVRCKTMMMVVVLLHAFVGVTTINTYAQSDTNQAAQQAQAAERLRAEQLRQQQLRLRQANNRAPSGAVPRAPSSGIRDKNATCLSVETISIDGVNLLPKELIADISGEFEGSCVGLADLNNILKKITFLYVQKGFITSRAYLPEQDLADGSLEIVVVEGVLEDISIIGFKSNKSNRVRTAFPNLKGKPVNLRDIEQGLDQINRLASRDATINLKAGENNGASILEVDVKQTKPIRVTAGSDNLGGVSTGEYQSRVDVVVDDLLSLNDQWSFAYQRSMANNSYYFTKNRPYSDTFNGRLSIPYGYWTFGINGSVNAYYSEIQGNISNIETSGKSQNLNFDVSRVIHRNQTSKTSISSGLGWKNNDNFILGSHVDISSRALATVHIGLAHSRQFLGGQVSASVDYYRGIKAFGAFNDGSASIGSPKGQFDKVSVYASYFKPFKMNDINFIFNTSLSGQLSDDLLFGSEQMSLGGYSTIRGVQEAKLFGNNVVIMRNELSMRFSPPSDPMMASLFGSIEPYLALDVGHVVEQSRHNIAGGSLAGVAVGLRNSQGKINFDIAYSDLVYAPTALHSIKSEPGVVYARLSLSF